MPIPLTGPISITMLAAEGDIPTSAPVSINNSTLRRIIRKFTPGTPISFSDFRGKSRFSFGNGNFATGDLTDTGATVATPGWIVYKSQVKLNGVNNIDGWPTPTDGTKPGLSPGDNTEGNGFSYTAEFSNDIPSEAVPGSRSLRLVSNGTSVAYGIIHGPYATTNSNNIVGLETGDIVSFWWKAEGGSDAYDIFAYLLDLTDGSTIELVNDTGSSGGATTPWTKVTKTISAAEAGNYKFVFVSGTYDFSGGTVLGASLYITNVSVKKWFDV